MLFFRLYSKKTIFVGKDSSMDDKWNALEKYNLWGGNTYQLGLERKSYTDKIGNFVGNNLVKVLIGQRRSGKSYILRQIASSLVSERGVNPANILYINRSIWNLILLMIIKHWKVCIVFIGKSLNRKEKYICFSMKFKMWMAGKGL